MQGPRDVAALLADARRLAGLSRRLGLDDACALINEAYARGRLDKAMTRPVPGGATDDERSYRHGPPIYPE